MNRDSDFNFEKERRKAIVVMIITISLFTLIVGGISFAFFGAQVTTTYVYANASIPAAPPDKTLNITKTDCELNINMAKMYKNISSNTSPIANSSCYVSVSINGNQGDYCTYDLKLENGSNPYVRSVSDLSSGTFEYSGTVSGSATKAETQMDSLAGTTIASGQTVTVATTGSAETKTYNLTTKFYNLASVNQKELFESTTVKKHLFKVTNVNCNFNH